MKISMQSNNHFVTSELLPYSRLIEPTVVNLLKKHQFGLCLCIHADQLNEDLHQLCHVFDQAGIPIIFWPLLSMTEGLYLNKYSVTEYYNYLDKLFDWVESRKHRIYGLLVDVEPDYLQSKPGSSPVIDNIWHCLRDLDGEACKAAISGFEKIIAKIRQHHCQAIGAAVPFVCDDKLGKSQAWQDYWGGPVGCVEWDLLVFMLYGSWFVEMGMSWPSAHYLIHDYTKTINKYWKNKAVVALGVTSPGTGAETALYQSPEQLVEAVSAVKAAGIHNIAVYDIKGILDSTDPELWFTKILSAQPLVPTIENLLDGHSSKGGKVEPVKIKIYHMVIGVLGKSLAGIETLKSLGKQVLMAFNFTRRI